MTAGAAAVNHGRVHQAALYGSDAELLAAVVPFLQDGEAAGERNLLSLGQPATALVRAAMPHAELVFVPPLAEHGNPAAVIVHFRRSFAELSRGGREVRMVAEMPHPGTGVPWHWWARFEAACNHVFDESPVWGLCVYDTRTTPRHVIDDVVATHPYLTSADGRRLANAAFQPPEDLLTWWQPVPDPLEAGVPDIELVDPTPSMARRAVHGFAEAVLNGQTDDLAYAVSEAVSNAVCHGRPPIRLRLWTGADRALVAVTDQGSGPDDQFVGLLPSADLCRGGMGLWMAHHMCSQVTFQRTERDFTIKLTAGNAHLAL